MRCILRKINFKFNLDLKKIIYILSECLIQNPINFCNENINSLKVVQNMNIIELEQKLKQYRKNDIDQYIETFDE